VSELEWEPWERLSTSDRPALILSRSLDLGEEPGLEGFARSCRTWSLDFEHGEHFSR